MAQINAVDLSRSSLFSTNNDSINSDIFNLNLLEADQLAQSTGAARNPNIVPVNLDPRPAPLLAPEKDSDPIMDLIGQALAATPRGTSAIIGTRINALPPEVLQLVPENVRPFFQNLGSASASVAIILPPDALQRIEQLGPGRGSVDVLLNSTLWLGAVPPSGKPAFSNNPAIPNGAYVLTIKLRGLTQLPVIDLRAGWAWLHDIRPGEIRNGRSPLVVDKADPDSWAFINAGVSGSVTSVTELPQTFQRGFDQLNNSFEVTPNAGGQPTVNFEVEGGGVVTAGVLLRIPYSEKLAHRAGQSLINFGSKVPVPPVAAVLSALGVVLNQSTGVYIGAGASVSRLSLNFSNGEFVYGIPGSTFNSNVGDAPAAAANIASDLVGPINQNLSDSIDRSAQPTRRTLREIATTPTNSVGGVPQSNDQRLGLYFDEYLDGLPAFRGPDLVQAGREIIEIYNTAPTTKENLSNIYYRPELEAVRILFQQMFWNPEINKLQIPNTPGADGRFGFEDLPQAFATLKTENPGDYNNRIKNLARTLYDSGWKVNFGIPDLGRAITDIERSEGPATRNALYDRVAPLLQNR